MRPACTSTPRPGSRTAVSSGWAPRSATRPRSCMPAGRSGCASCARRAISSTATVTSARKVGLLGGTFNPPHLGHLVCAQEARARLGLDVVLFVPTYLPPHKEVEADPGVDHRVELCRRAVGDDSRFAVSRVEADVAVRSYTVDTLRRLHATHPAHDLTFIVGGDMAYALPTWHEPEALLSL